MKKFQYIEARYSWEQDATKKLNELGDNGWELVAVTQELDGTEQNKNQRAVLIRYTLKKEVGEKE